MNRTIIFRGKRIDNGEWIYGSFAETHGTPFIGIPTDPDNPVYMMDWHEVDPDTVGQFTGLLDKNGKEIYEGDIVVDDFGNDYEVCWYYDLACFMAEMICNERPFLLYDIEPNKCEIIGNMHDNNPELLNEK